MLVAPQFSNAQKREVTTYMVTPRDRGSLHCSIQQAIDKADPYSRIVLGPGQYFESLTLQQPLEIVGEEGADTPEVSTRGICLSLLGDVETYFENVKFTSKTSQFAKTLSRSSQTAVRVTGGRPTFHKCVMTSLFVGGEACPTVSKCTIEGNLTGSGLVVGEAAAGEYSDNTICNHIPFAVHIKSRAVPTFTNNYIYQDPKYLSHHLAGVYVDRQGGAVLVSQDSVDNDDITRSISPRFIGNRIGDEVALGPHSTTTFESQMITDVALNGDFEQFFCERRTVVVEAGCSPHFEENVITGGHVGVTLSTASSGTFVNNNISRASSVGVLGGALSSTTVRFNVISRCGTGLFAQNTSISLTQNTIKENIGSGMLLLLGTEDRFRMESNSFVGNDIGVSVRPSFSANRLRGLAARVAKEGAGGGGGGGDGASPKGSMGEAVLSKNYICLNKSAGVLTIGEGYKLTMEDLDIGANGKYGVLCAFGATPLFRNVRFDRGAVGLVIERSAHPRVEECQFTGHTDAAIVSRDRGKGHIVSNNITGFAKVGLLIDDGGNPCVERNTFASNSGSAIVVTHGGAGEIGGNTIDMVSRGICVSSFGDPVVYGNKITSCTEMGIYVCDEGCGTFYENVITACGVGVACSMGGECCIRGNEIKSCTRFGVISSEGSRLILEKNTIESNVGGNVLLEGFDSQALVRSNVIARSSGFGVRSCREAQGTVLGNTVTGNKDGGIGSESEGNTYFARNTCVKERGAGISIRPFGRGLFQSNVVEDSEVGVELLPQCNAEIKDCTFSNNEVSGIRLHSGCGGTVRGCSVDRNRGPGIDFHGISANALTILDSLTISGNAEEGMRVTDHCSGKMIKSTVSGHRVGASFSCAGSMVLDGCTFLRNGVGARFERKGVASLTGCVFRLQDDADVEFAAEGRGTVSHCSLGDGSTVGVLGSYNGGGNVVDCTIRSAVVAGAKFLKGCYTSVQKTVIEECSFGVLCEEMSSPTIRKCQIRASVEGNVKLCATSSVNLLESTIEKSRTSGILNESRSGRIEGNTISCNEEHGVRMCSTDPNDDERGDYIFSRSVLGGPGGSANRRKSVQPARRKSQAVAANVTDSKETSLRTEAGPAVRQIFTKNIICKNEWAGVFFDIGTESELRDNEIHLNGKGGVIISQGCTPDIGSGNRIHHNSEGGVVLLGQCSPTVTKSSIFQNDPVNIMLHERSSGVLEDCEICEAIVDGVRAIESLTQIRKCRISGCAQGCGILLTGVNKYLIISENEFLSNGVGVAADVPQAYAKVTKNRFRHNITCGVRIENGGCPEISENSFEQGTIGIWLKDGAGGSVINNRFVRNAEGLSITGVSISTTCKDNSFEDNDKGVVLRQTDGFIVESSTFGPNESAAISCEEGARGTIRDNKFQRGHRGVLTLSSATPIISSNHFNQVKCGVEVIGRSIPRLERNAFQECETGCRFSSTATGIVATMNGFFNCAISGVTTEKQSNPAVSRNVFSDCNILPSSTAILCTEGGAGQFSDNDIHRNSIGIIGTQNGGGEFLRCMVHDNRLGTSFEGLAHTSFDRCTFFNNAAGDVISRLGATPSFKNCFFNKCQSPAVQLTTQGSGTFQSCQFRECQTAFLVEDCSGANVSNNLVAGGAIGILLRKAATRATTISRNVFTGCDVAFQCSAGGSAALTQNFVTGCDTGALIERRSGVKLMHNTFHKCTKHGIFLRGNGNVTIANNVVQDCNVAGLQVSVTVDKQQPQAPASTTTSYTAGLPQSDATASEALSSTIISENLFSGSRINVQISCGEVIFRKNHVSRGDYGVSVLPEARATFDGNTVYDCVRASFTLGSRNCTLTSNLFYSLNDSGAFETSHDAPNILSKDNGVYNSCSCKLAPPQTSAPQKVNDVDVFRGKDILSTLQQSLLSLHTNELPKFAPCGCTAIPGSFERATVEEEGEEVEKKKGTGLMALKKVASLANMTRRRKSALSDSIRADSASGPPDIPLPPAPPKTAAVVSPTGMASSVTGSSASTSFRRGSTASLSKTKK